jgi:lipooligosaccharide transport system permease protein
MSMFLEIFRVPSVGMGFLRIWERNLLVFKANAIETALTVAVEPLVFYWALAYGLGQYVELINGMSFVEYLFPGFMLLTSMSVAYSETSHNCYLKITPRGHYSNYQYTPLRQSEIAMGEILWGAFKGFLAGACISAFAYQQDFFVLKNLGSVAVALLLTSILFSSLGLLVMTHVKNYESFSVAYALILLPKYLLSGALFPLDSLPEA